MSEVLLMMDWPDEDQPLSEWIVENDRDDTPGKYITQVVRRLESLTDDEYPLTWNAGPWFPEGHLSRDFSKRDSVMMRIHRIECEAGVLVLHEYQESYKTISHAGRGRKKRIPAGFAKPGFSTKELMQLWRQRR